MNKQEAADFLKNNIIPILVVIYFGRLTIPQGLHSITITALFYAFTFYVFSGGVVVIGIIGIIGLIRSQITHIPFTARNKSFLLSAVLGLTLFSLSSVTHHAYDHKNFDAGLWRDARVSLDFDSNLITPRQRMMNDLVENVLPGLTRNEAEHLLGSPDYSWQLDGGGWKFRYVVGPEKGLGVDNECLEIQFDEKGHFESYDDIPVCD